MRGLAVGKRFASGGVITHGARRRRLVLVGLGFRAGSRTSKTVPAPSSRPLTRMRPRMRLTNVRTIYRPRPVPGLSRSSSSPKRTKRPNILRRDSRGMPRPLSAIRTTAHPSGVTSRLTSTRGSAPAYFAALSMRLRKTISRSVHRGVDQAGPQVQRHDIRRQAIPRENLLHATLQQQIQLDVFAIFLGGRLFQMAGLQDVIDQVVEPLNVFQHVAVEGGLFAGADLAAVEGLGIELERRDRRLQLMRDAVDEVRLPPREIDGLHRQGQVEHDAAQHQTKQSGAHRQQNPGHRRRRDVGVGPADGQQHPTNAQRHDQHDHDDAQGNRQF